MSFFAFLTDVFAYKDTLHYTTIMNISELQKQISPILQTYGVKRAAVFGSVSRGEDKPDSDVDLLVKLGKPMGMFMYMDFTSVSLIFQQFSKRF